MGKVIKVIDLLNESTKGNNLSFRKDGGSYIDSLWSFFDMYLYRKMSFEEIVRWLNSEVEILDEVDIQGIEGIHIYDIKSIGISEGKCLTGRNLDIFLGNKINELLKAVKQLDNKINKLESED